MQNLLHNIKACTVCKDHLPLGPRPIISAHLDSKIAIIGQAPGLTVHKTGIPWDDPSGRQLRNWLGVTDAVFYDDTKIALIPMGFCYPGRGKTGDLPPRTECAPQWHKPLFDKLKNIDLVILIGMYAQSYYLGKNAKKTLTETVKSHKEYLPNYLPLPHPSPRNRFWLAKNPWFEKEVLPVLRQIVKELV